MTNRREIAEEAALDRLPVARTSVDASGTPNEPNGVGLAFASPGPF